MRKLTRKIWQSIFVSISLLSYSPAHAWEYSLYTQLGLGHIEGIAQTPKGGDVGTTSMNRPTFAEIDICNGYLNEIEVGVTHATIFTLLAYQSLYAHGSTSLTQGLLTHDQYIPSGNDFTLHTRYRLTTLQIGKNIPVPNIPLTISPLMEGAFIKYHYGFSAPTAKSNRDFNLAALSVGFSSHYQFYQKISIDFAAKNTLPLSNLRMAQIDMGVNYALSFKKHLTFIPRLSLGFLRIDYEDEQTVPNHIRYQVLPYGTLGFSLLWMD